MALRLDEIRIYPIKSLPGIRVSHANVLGKGLEFDRRFMLIDRNNRFMTQRTLPQLSQYRLSLADGTITISSKEVPEAGVVTLGLKAGEMKGPSLSAEVWDDVVTVVEADPKLSSWFSRTLGMECKLVLFPEGNPRAVDPDYAPDGHHVSLADGYPMLIIGIASLDDLNARLEQPVTMDRFRPNLVFSGGTPYQEDGFREFRIGKNIFAGVKPCSRCNLITIDPVTGEAGAEPLRTLSGYRTRNNKVYFGQNVIALSHDHINEGDEIHLS